MPHIHELIDFTVSAFILHPTEPRLLLVKHRKIGKWLQPGGHIELNENPLQALTHELSEETGLQPSDYTLLQPDQPTGLTHTAALPVPFQINQHAFNDTHQHIDLSYIAKAHTDTLTETPDGADDIRWCTLAELKDFATSDEIFPDTLHICEWVLSKAL
jgi:8-oxo-dGTP pyrophosphatase MutT (NUDIX family)